MGTGCPCFGCSEKGVGFTKPLPEQASLKYFTPAGVTFKGDEGKPRAGGGALCLTPSTAYPPISPTEGHSATTAAGGLVAGLAGLAVGAGAVTAMKLGKEKSGPGAETAETKKD